MVASSEVESRAASDATKAYFSVSTGIPAVRRDAPALG
jgi:hypothetical protein